VKWSNIFVVTYGRTGSTLLMGILNSYEGIRVKGENLNFIKGLFWSYKQLSELKKTYGNGQDVTAPFYGAETTNIDQYLSASRQLIKEQLLSKLDENIKCWGFKEIRYTPVALNFDGQYDLAGYLDFLKLLFPEACFIFLTRDHYEVSKSAFWREVKEENVCFILGKIEERFKKWSVGRGDTFEIDYQEMVNKTVRLEEMHEFLGVNYSESHVKVVMETNYSYGNLKKYGYGLPEIKVFELNEVLELKLDERKKETPLNRNIISGVLVLKSNFNLSEYSLVSYSDLSNKYLPVVWSISSPYFIAKYPKNSNAKTARFISDSPYDNELKVFLQDNNLNRQLVIHLKREKNE